jgi:intracellular sulfur oxidation DsrE/DsrF family protein
MMIRNAAAIVAVGFLTFGAAAHAQMDLLVPGQPVARDVPGAKTLPDPNTEYKVVFDIITAPDNVDDVNPRLVRIARYVNTLGKYGVPEENRKIAVVLHRAATPMEENRKIAVVLHRAATPMILKNDEFKARNNGHSNPNIELIRSLAAAGVDFRVCGQAALGRNIDPADILPEIQLDLWAFTTLIDLRTQGYLQVGP